MYRSINAGTSRMAETPINASAQPRHAAISGRIQKAPIPRSTPPTQGNTRVCRGACLAEKTESIAITVVRQHVPMRLFIVAAVALGWRNGSSLCRSSSLESGGIRPAALLRAAHSTISR